MDEQSIISMLTFCSASASDTEDSKCDAAHHHRTKSNEFRSNDGTGIIGEYDNENEREQKDGGRDYEIRNKPIGNSCESRLPASSEDSVAPIVSHPNILTCSMVERLLRL